MSNLRRLMGQVIFQREGRGEESWGKGGFTSTTNPLAVMKIADSLLDKGLARRKKAQGKPI